MDKNLVYYGVGFSTGVVVGFALPLATVTFVGYRGYRRIFKKLGKHVTDDQVEQALATVTNLMPKDSHLSVVSEVGEEEKLTTFDEVLDMTGLTREDLVDPEESNEELEEFIRKHTTDEPPPMMIDPDILG